MAIARCNKGHIYDDSLGGCPVCAKGDSVWPSFGKSVEDIPATSPIDQWQNMEDIPVTSPADPDQAMEAIPGTVPADPWQEPQGVPVIVPADGFQWDPIGVTKPVADPGFAGGEDQYQFGPEGETVKKPERARPEKDPVVGWLVCVKGPDRGRDYPLHSGTNFIGRDRDMDVCIEHDQSVSKHNAASISYDDRSKTFFIERGEVRNLIYLNGRSVRSDADVLMYDRIEIGETELMFVPLCGPDFSWQDL